MTIAVLTALLGSTPDYLPASPPADTDVIYGCVTDRATALPDGWTRLTVPPAIRRSVPSSRLQARWVRAFPETWYPDATITIWMDASFDWLMRPSEVVDVAAAIRLAGPDGCDLVAFRHHDRATIRAEAAAVVDAGQLSHAQVAEIVRRYHAAGFDTAAIPQRDLTAGGFLIRWRSSRTADFSARWWAELTRFGERADQLSLDFCAWQAGLTIGYLSHRYCDNPFVLQDSRRHRGIA